MSSLSLSLSLIPPSHLSLPLPPPLCSPPPHPSSCSEGLLDQVLCLEERLALTQLSSIGVCVWAVCVACACVWRRRRPVKYISDPHASSPFNLSLTSAVVSHFLFSLLSLPCILCAARPTNKRNPTNEHSKRFVCQLRPIDGKKKQWDSSPPPLLLFPWCSHCGLMGCYGIHASLFSPTSHVFPITISLLLLLKG